MLWALDGFGSCASGMSFQIPSISPNGPFYDWSTIHFAVQQDTTCWSFLSSLDIPFIQNIYIYIFNYIHVLGCFRISFVERCLMPYPRATTSALSVVTPLSSVPHLRPGDQAIGWCWKFEPYHPIVWHCMALYNMDWYGGWYGGWYDLIWLVWMAIQVAI